MKKLIAAIAIALPLAFSARAQWIVYDPTSNIQQIIDQAVNVAKYVQMIDNQVQQIQTLTDQLTEFKNYEAVFGDPKKIVLSMIPTLSADLTKIEPVQNLENLLKTADGNYALTYAGSGLTSRHRAARPSRGLPTCSNPSRPSTARRIISWPSPPTRRRGA